MRFVRGCAWTAVLGLALAAVPSASANTVQLKLVDYNDVGIGFNLNGAAKWAPGGGLVFEQVGGSPVLPSPLYANCIEIFQDLTPNQIISFDLTDIELAPVPGQAVPTPITAGPMGATKAALLQELYSRTYSDNLSDAERAAFQLAIWEIVYDGDLNVVAPYGKLYGYSNMYQSQSLTALAQSYLNAVALDDNFMPIDGLTALVNDDYQDIAIIVPESLVVPLPGAVWGGLALLGTLAGIRARRRA